MADQIDVERQRHELPSLLGELSEVLEQLLGVGPTIGPDRSQMSTAYSIAGMASSLRVMPSLRLLSRSGSAGEPL
jgi:hypothetical protein